MKIAGSIRELIGETPIVRLDSISSNAEVVAKCEFMNPLGSIKDRVALNVIMKAIERGEINSDTVVIEATSGNTGIALASITASLGLKMIVVMPESMSKERKNLIKFFDSNLVLTPASEGMTGAVAKAEDIRKNNPNSFIVSQFMREDNPNTHRETTAKEILRDTDGKIDIFVVGVGSGGSITGIGETLKKEIPNLKIVAVEPEESAILSGEEASPHKIQGIGAGFIPKILNRDIFDEVLQIKGDDAIKMARKLAYKDGFLVGISSGANVLASQILAQRRENKGKRILTILNDTGERYLSTELFEK
ncbi:cysteine synthase A [Thiovulum sp. ES]|nr:cysteine synthase A [Thiovulum sp. ES]